MGAQGSADAIPDGPLGTQVDKTRGSQALYGTIPFAEKEPLPFFPLDGVDNNCESSLTQALYLAASHDGKMAKGSVTMYAQELEPTCRTGLPRLDPFMHFRHENAMQTLTRQAYDPDDPFAEWRPRPIFEGNQRPMQQLGYDVTGGGQTPASPMASGGYPGMGNGGNATPKTLPPGYNDAPPASGTATPGYGAPTPYNAEHFGSTAGVGDAWAHDGPRSGPQPLDTPSRTQLWSALPSQQDARLHQKAAALTMPAMSSSSMAAMPKGTDLMNDTRSAASKRPAIVSRHAGERPAQTASASSPSYGQTVQQTTRIAGAGAPRIPSYSPAAVVSSGGISASRIPASPARPVSSHDVRASSPSRRVAASMPVGASSPSRRVAASMPVGAHVPTTRPSIPPPPSITANPPSFVARPVAAASSSSRPAASSTTGPRARPQVSNIGHPPKSMPVARTPVAVF